jgi:signal peptidase I
MTSTLRTHRTWRRAAGLVLAGLVALVAAAFATGLIGYVDTNGDSMEPLYHTGDLVVVARAEQYHTGEIVAYHGGTDGHLVILHRIVGGKANGFVIKGDNNRSVDPTRPRASQIIGHAVLSIPRIGGVIGSPITHVVLLLALLVLIVAFIKNPAPERRAAHAARRARDPWIAAWKLLLGLDVLLLAALGLSFGLSSSTATANTPAYTQTGVFTYQAQPPVSDAYPTGHVVTGDPVFVRLLTALGVSFHYSTNAPSAAVHGTVRLDAALSDAMGWHSTLPMVAPTPLKAGGANLAATLDLSRIQSLATSVSSQTGLGAVPVNVAVTASAVVGVGSAKPVRYTSQLPLQLTSLEATLAGAKVSAWTHGLGVVSTSPLNPTASVAHHSDPVHRDIRLGLLASLLLAVAATAVIWPSATDRTARNIAHEPGKALESAKHTNDIQRADREALEQVAHRLAT